MVKNGSGGPPGAAGGVLRGEFEAVFRDFRVKRWKKEWHNLIKIVHL